MNSSPVLRAGRDTDAAGFIELIGACWAEYPGCVMDLDGEVPELRALATYYAGQGGALWVGERNERVLGMVATRPHPDGVWELCKMYVAAEARGSGLAATLLHTAEAHARARGGTRMVLWSDTRFDRAHRFYEKASFLRSGPLRVLNDKSASIEFRYEKPLSGVRIVRLDAAAAVSAVERLATILVACVDSGASVSFLRPLPMDKARAFWKRRASEVATGGRVLLAAWVDGVLGGTVALDLAMPDNQPHRADLQKLLVHPELRRRGVARLLMQRIEQEAAAEGRRLVVLDTKDGDTAEALYRDMGWVEVGIIPDFALDPDGTAVAGTRLFWKHIARPGRCPGPAGA